MSPWRPREPNELAVDAELLAEVFRAGGERYYSVQPGPSEGAAIVGARLDRDSAGNAWVVLEYDRPVEESAFRVEWRPQHEALREWAAAWDATHGRTFAGPGPHPELERRDRAEEALRAVARGSWSSWTPGRTGE